MNNFKREVGMFKAGAHAFVKSGNGASVFNGGDFFEFLYCINKAKSDSKKFNVCLLHSHPPGVKNASKDDIESFTGIRLGMARDFTAIIVLSDKYIVSYDVKLNGMVKITKRGLIRNWLTKIQYWASISYVWALTIINNADEWKNGKKY